MGKNKNKRNVKVRLLFNGSPYNREEIRKEMQNNMRQHDKDCQAQRVVAVTSEESLLQIEMSLTMEPTFSTEDERQL
eukprot:11372616-Ditylum_brightwellii.AAC.1